MLCQLSLLIRVLGELQLLLCSFVSHLLDLIMILRPSSLMKVAALLAIGERSSLMTNFSLSMPWRNLSPPRDGGDGGDAQAPANAPRASVCEMN